MSANTGRAPAIITASAEYAAESGGVITSSPGPMSSARRINVIASVPVPTPTACGDAARRRKLGLERLDLGAEHEPAAREHAIDRRLDVGDNPRPASAR